MTSRDELIEESFKAHEAAPSWQDDPAARDAAVRWHLRGFNDALAVLEKAHAPTGEPESSAEHFHIWSDLPCKPGQCRMEPQGEPTDAQVSAALLGYFPEVEGQMDLQDWGKNTRDRMRAALRAAAAVREGGKP